ncbi:52 kDa repressor of the inhibitor of the protein kinase-like [Daktulosphaira vitifoliae]|uniref:52 kDa repressor of the inhibitor of the protein kinase-like n=1 Tax=Daktulosphaira vitifoliae TaxID=58002 RepID=UPI0021AA7E35|nr:52 kDa repressor of the inhibitor of the protein kinase-like [Daktulosphaira vitifoliae]
MSQKRSKPVGTLLNFISIKPKIPKINDLPDPQEIFASPSQTSNTTGNYQHFSSYDISLFVDKKLNNQEKIQVLQNVWVPNNNFNFPIQQIGNQSRKFNILWLTKYKWLTYSKIEDSAFCKVCVLFSPSMAGYSSNQSLHTFVKKGFNNWKKGLEKFEKHGTLNYHKEANLKADNFMDVMSGKILSIDKQIDKAHHHQALENQEKLKPIIKTIILCGRQCLPLRAHRDYGTFNVEQEPECNEGNFRALLRARIDSGDKNLKQHLMTCGKNSTYISWNIQNQIIDACDEIILSKLVTKVNSAKCFAVLADETSDISSIEQFSLCVRYIECIDENNFKIVEQFLKFVPVESTSGQNLADVLLTTLNACGININYLRGQGYDGAAAMSGRFKGVQACITEKYPTALYVHCVSHSLNLALSNAVDVISIRNSFGVIEKFCPTRWVERHDSIIVFNQFLLLVVAALEEIQPWNCKDSSSGAFLLLNSIRQSTFIISLLCSEKLLAYTLPISKVLQTTDIDLSTAVNQVGSVVSILHRLRSNAENEFKLLFLEAQQIASNLDFTLSTPRLTKHQTKRSNAPSENIEEYYRRSIFVPWIDSFLNSLSDRFLKHKNLLTSFKCLLPTGHTPTDEQISSFKNLFEFYEKDMQHISFSVAKAEFELWCFEGDQSDEGDTSPRCHASRHFFNN